MLLFQPLSKHPPKSIRLHLLDLEPGMRRREFITLLGSATAAWPLIARAQQAGGIRRIAVLMPFAKSHPEGQARNEAFLQELQKLGWTEGRNLQI